MYTITIKTQFEGFHRYKDAPEEVSFLRNFHRHLFEVEVEIETDHSNRDLEFFIVKSKIDAFLSVYSGWENRFEFSCEALAEKLFDYLVDNYKVISCSVKEDQENKGTYYGQRK